MTFVLQVTHVFFFKGVIVINKLFYFVLSIVGILVILTCSPGDTVTVPDDNKPIDTENITAGLTAISSALAQKNPDSLKALMTPTARKLYGDAAMMDDSSFNKVSAALSSAVLKSSSALYAEYELKIDGLTYTIELTRTEQGKPWLIARF